MRLKQEKAEQIKEKYKLDYIAKQLGISKQFISYLFNNKRTCSKKTAIKILEVIGNESDIEEYFDEN